MIVLDQLSHRYRGGALALDSLSLEIERGACFGLIGANGAGKTTTLRILATLLAPSSGRATVDSHDVTAASDRVRPRIGYMPETYTLVPELTVRDLLDYVAALYGFRGSDKQRRVEAVLSLVDLEGRADHPCGSLSRGLQQRVALARTLVHDPPVLILDEPSSGLDPAARIEVRHILRDLNASGKTIVLSSHILPELSEVCSSLGILERGRLVLAGEVGELLRRMTGPRELEIEVDGDAAAAAALLRPFPGVEQVDVDGARARVRFSGPRQALPDLVRELVRNGVLILFFGERRTSLEEIFLNAGAFET